MGTVEHPDKGGHPGRVGDIGRLPVLTQLALMRLRSMVRCSFDNRHAHDRILFQKSRPMPITSTLNCGTYGFLFLDPGFPNLNSKNTMQDGKSHAFLHRGIYLGKPARPGCGL